MKLSIWQSERWWKRITSCSHGQHGHAHWILPSHLLLMHFKIKFSSLKLPVVLGALSGKTFTAPVLYSVVLKVQRWFLTNSWTFFICPNSECRVCLRLPTSQSTKPISIVRYGDEHVRGSNLVQYGGEQVRGSSLIYPNMCKSWKTGSRTWTTTPETRRKFRDSRQLYD